MYASFKSVSAKNGKTLTPTRTRNFLLTAVDWEFHAVLSSGCVRKTNCATRWIHTHDVNMKARPKGHMAIRPLPSSKTDTGSE